MKIIAICNQKGGVGKTTTAVNLAACLTERGYRVLAIDLDHQCNLGMYLGHEGDAHPTIADLILTAATGTMPQASGEVIRHSACGVDYIPASLRLAKADIVLAQAMCRERILSNVLNRLPVQDYDYCIIDCSPQMGVLLHNALYAADGVVIPVQTEDFSMEGLDDMLGLIDMIRASGKELKVMGVIPTMMTPTTVSENIVRKLRERFGDTCYVGIRRSIDAARSAATRTPLIGTKSRLAEQYRTAALEFLQHDCIPEDRLEWMVYEWSEETNDPESEAWRDELNDLECAVVAMWDDRIAQGMARLASECLKNGGNTSGSQK